ncbi:MULTISPECIES: lipoyl(octanoyl) transferase LipB [Brachybacterium]|uniref:Octanoyltransferase n=1 Tax=Brachybacterium alimentarium TaxID=47845 RepID=A0A2A3YFM5_9MICO|nr:MULTISPECIES: lipoyl(octanoyl) transferase LipB [Brachybacterium]PCC31927.1 lipoate-protein ligase B [Brachybacterium alimentarium]PCC38143.1 lipoate-protein ligase B [Brachybacterium alimentarium]RCS66919.1 lipoyl(octanoyl) transferase LipB [Brachybacterium sp. JB7]RCS71778.1 lipoyl(octanoyl) transferase LipB [Brachybacterium alimentarium]RCS74141.1 lipoyl(octanoyl) transferase LipB [Brachybacterium alimentarium]
MLDVIRLGFSEPLPGGDRHEEFSLPAGPVDYRAAWALQRRIHGEVVAGDRPDTLLLLEHAPVYTAGKLTEDHERPRDGAEVIDIDRGGKITWHGPQQLVGYPIVRLPIPIDVVGFVRDLERTLIDVCTEVGVRTVPLEGRSGVWVAPENAPARKVCAIGLRVSKRVTMHGFALNCANDLSWAHNVIPCGIDDAGVTSLSQEAGRRIAVADVVDHAAEALSDLVAHRTSAPAV